MKFSGKGGNGLVNKWLNFSSDPNPDPNPYRDTGKMCLGESMQCPIASSFYIIPSCDIHAVSGVAVSKKWDGQYRRSRVRDVCGVCLPTIGVEYGRRKLWAVPASRHDCKFDVNVGKHHAGFMPAWPSTYASYSSDLPESHERSLVSVE